MRYITTTIQLPFRIFLLQQLLHVLFALILFQAFLLEYYWCNNHDTLSYNRLVFVLLELNSFISIFQDGKRSVISFSVLIISYSILTNNWLFVVLFCLWQLQHAFFVESFVIIVIFIFVQNFVICIIIIFGMSMLPRV